MILDVKNSGVIALNKEPYCSNLFDRVCLSLPITHSIFTSILFTKYKTFHFATICPPQNPPYTLLILPYKPIIDNPLYNY